MKKIIVTTILTCLMTMMFMLQLAAWDNTLPADNSLWNNAAGEIRANWDALEAAFGVDLANAIETGDNVTFGTGTFSGLITANAGVTLGAGDDLVGSATSDITWGDGSDKFIVAGATGNTVIEGTLGVTGVATLADASLLATAAAPTDPCHIANMAYVDAQFTVSAWTANDSDAATMLKSHAYLTTAVGYAYASSNDLQTGETLIGYVDTDSDPATGGTVVGHIEASANNITSSILFPVGTGIYFEIVTEGSQLSLRWQNYGTLSAPVDQD